MTTYAVTINPSPYKKWLEVELLDTIYQKYGKLYTKQYNRLPQYVQEQLLLCILDYLVKNAFVNIEWSDHVFESTALGNRHIHVYFKVPKDVEFEDNPNDNEVVVLLNSVFGCCKASHPAIYIEETRKDIIYWKHYMKKDQYLETLMKIKIPMHDFD